MLLYQYVLLTPARHLGVVPSSQRFVELYVSDPAKLPSTARVGRRLTVHVEVTSHEPAATFAWRSDLAYAGSTQPTASGHLRVAPGATRRLAVVVVPRSAGDATLSIRLVGTADALSFHLKVTR